MSPSSSPPVRPKAWKIGSGLKTTSVSRQVEARVDLRDIGEKVGVRQRDALRHALRARGEQHDRRIVGLALRERRGRPSARRGACPSAVALARTSSSQTMRATSPIASTSGRDCPSRRRRARSARGGFAPSRRRRRDCAGPAVKLSIAGTRPAACSAMKVTAAPLALGSMRPIDLARRRDRRRSCAPARRRRCGTCASVSAPLSGSSTATRDRPRASSPTPRTPRAACGGCRTSGTRGPTSCRRARRRRPAAAPGRVRSGGDREPPRRQEGDRDLRKQPPADLRGVEPREEGCARRRRGAPASTSASLLSAISAAPS